eukprot:4729927-Amphidinium_carterae.2
MAWGSGACACVCARVCLRQAGSWGSSYWAPAKEQTSRRALRCSPERPLYTVLRCSVLPVLPGNSTQAMLMPELGLGEHGHKPILKGTAIH